MALAQRFTNTGVLQSAGEINETSIDNTIPALSRYSAYFSGTNYLTIQANAAFAFGNGDFTIEFWARPSIATRYEFFDIWNNAFGARLLIYNDASGNLIYYNTTSIRITGGPLTINTWQHIAVVRISGTTKMYLNGTQTGSDDTAAFTVSSGMTIYLGRDGSNGATSADYIGYMSNLRVVNGVGVYTGTFTVPTTNLTTIQSASTNIQAITGTQTSLLALQSTTATVIVDNSSFNNYISNISFPSGFVTVSSLSPFATPTSTPITWPAAQHSRLYPDGRFIINGGFDEITLSNYTGRTGYSVYNNGSAFSATGVGYADTSGGGGAIFNAQSTNWTIELWFKVAAWTDGANSQLYLEGNTGSTTRALSLMFTGDGGSIGIIEVAVNSYFVLNSILALNTWHHLALVCNTTLTLYIDGVAQTNLTNRTNFITTTGTTTINQWKLLASSLGAGAYGLFSNLRINNSVSAYGTSIYSGITTYTQPTTALTVSVNTTKLLTAQSATVIDATSTSTVTNAGTVTTTNATIPFSNTYSYVFNGTSQYMTIPYTTANFDWWLNDYTIEAWIYPTTVTGWSYSAAGIQVPTLIQNGGYNSTTCYWAFGINASSQVAFYYFNGTIGNVVTSSSTVTLNAWNHIAMVKTSAGITLYVKGVKQTTTTISGTPQSSVSSTLTIGAGNSTYITGNVSNLRIYRAAVYTQTFAVQTVPLVFVNSTKLLTAQSATITDVSSTSTLTNFGSITAGNSTIPFANTYSYQFNGTNQYLTAPYGAGASGTSNFDWWVGDCIIEAWIYPTSFTGWSTQYAAEVPTLIGNMNFSGNVQWAFGIDSGTNTGTPGKVLFYYSVLGGGGYTSVTSATSVSLNTWSHIAMTKTSAGITLFVNGAVNTPVPLINGTPYSISTWGLTIGGNGGGAPNNYYITGYVSNLRMAKGIDILKSNLYGVTPSQGSFTPSPRLSTTQSAGTNTFAMTYGTELLTFNSSSLVDQSSNAFTITRGNYGCAIISSDYPPYPSTITSSTPLRSQLASTYQVFDSIDETTLAYTITPDKLLANEGDTVTYTVNAPLLGTGTLYWTNSGSTVAADFIGGLTQGLTPLTWSGTSTAAVWSAANIPQLSSSGNGTGAVFSFKKTGALTTAATFGVLNVLIITPGTGYAIGDTILIDGVALTGLSSTYNITLTVGSDWFAQVVYPSTATGTGLGTVVAGAATWTCPDGVYRVSVVCIGGGGGGASGASPGGGGGGALAYIVDYAVIPNTTYSVQAGAGGAAATAGGSSFFVSVGGVCGANGGSPGQGGVGGLGGAVVSGGGGGSGGRGGASATVGGGGGGAGGYLSRGGNGGTSSGAAPTLVTQSGENSTDGGGGGSTGGGAGGLNQDGTVNNSTTGNGGGGGGTNPNGTFGSGIGGVLLAGTTGAILGQSGTGGSGGATGGASSATVGGAGGAYGGGGGGGTTTGGAGGAGTVRIIWNYPHGFLSPTDTLTTVTNTVLLTAQAAMSGLNATDTTGINTISMYGGTITAVASPIPFVGTFSNGAFATASYLTVSLPPKTWNPSTDTTWTIEGWLYMTTTGQFCLVSGQTAGTTVFYIQWGGSTVVVSDGTNTPISYNITTYVISTWYHIAVVNTSGTLSLYVNGVLRGSGANTLASNAIDTLVLGRNLPSGFYLSGNLSNFRLVKGTAVYSGASFTVPTTALTAITNTLVLTCQSSTTVIDNSSSPSVVTSTGGVTAISQSISASQVPFTVGYSYLFNGTSHYLTVPSSSNFVFGSGDFTIEGWAYPSATTINKGLIYKRTGSGISGVGFGTSTTTINRFQLYVANATGSAWTVSDATAGTFAINTWYHFAITKTNGYIYFYLNGLMVRQYAHTTAIYDDGSLLNIGRDPGGSFWVGNISNIRIIKGTALYYPTTVTNRNYPDYPPVTTNSGSVTITNGTGTLLLPISQDVSQEGVQDIQLQLRSDSTSGTILATAPTVLVADTSRPLALPGGGQCWCAYPNYTSGPNLTYDGVAGYFTFTAPKGYTTVSVVCIGGGGNGGYNGGSGGGGGALAYIASFAVTAGTTYAVFCGAGGTAGGAGGASSFNTSTVIANGGNPGTSGGAGGTGGTVGAGTGFAGGAGGAVSVGGASYSGGGGGGAGGYTAAGGVGGAVTGTYPTLTAASGAASATGGAGGGAGGSSTAGAYFASGGGGGGTSPFGSVAVASIAGIAYAGTGSSPGRGGGGSGGVATTAAFGVQLGQNGYTASFYNAVPFQVPNGGRFGGGGGGGDGNIGIPGDGGPGCVRIIWGTGRAYPATLTADRVSGYPASVGNPAGQQ